MLNIVNMVHSSAVVLGSYGAFFAWQRFGVSPFLAALAVAPAVGLLGYPIRRLSRRPRRRGPVLITLVMTFAVDLVLNNAILVAFTVDYGKITGASGLPPFRLGTVVLPADRLIATRLAGAAVYALHLHLHSSRPGRAIVAVRRDSETAKLMGIRVERI